MVKFFMNNSSKHKLYIERVEIGNQITLTSVHTQFSHRNYKNMSSEHPVVLGSRGFHLFVNEFKGVPKVHIRKQFRDQQTGTVYPTKQGITLSLEEWGQLLENRNEIQGELGRMQYRYNQAKMANSSQNRYQPYPRVQERQRHQNYYQERRQEQPQHHSISQERREDQSVRHQSGYKVEKERNVNPENIEVPDFVLNDFEQSDIDELFNGPVEY